MSSGLPIVRSDQVDPMFVGLFYVPREHVVIGRDVDTATLIFDAQLTLFDMHFLEALHIGFISGKQK